MTRADHLAIDQFPPEADRGTRLATWYAQGHADGLGDRLLMFDNTGGPSWEILRFTPALARHAGFEAAVRQRVEQLRSFQNSAFPVVRPVGDLGEGGGLAVVTTHVSGVSLSEVVKKPRTAEFTVLLIRQLLTALTALQEHAAGIAHGALTADRIVLTADGHPTIREHMLGSALESLELSTDQLWAAFGIAGSLERQEVAPIGPSTDVVQVALLAVSLLAGRRIGPRDYGDGIGGLLDGIAQRHGTQDGTTSGSLRQWLERALKQNGEPFDSARSANEALAGVPGGAGHHTDRAGASPRLATGPATASPRLAAGPATASPRRPPARVAASGHVSPRPPGDRPSAWAAERKRRRRRARVIAWTAAAAAIIAIGEAAFIGRLMRSDPASTSTADAARAGVWDEPTREPLPAEASAPAAPLPSGGRREPPPMPSLADVVAPAVRRVSEAPRLPETMSIPLDTSTRRGGFTVSSPIALHVLSGDRLIGSSDEGPIIAAAGRHELDFVNSVVGYRTRRIVDVAAGRVSSVSITVPNGSLNINAIPWAEVWVDGAPLGETPLGNVSLPPGEHEILFRHPELGERRETAIVRPDTLGRVAVTLRP